MKGEPLSSVLEPAVETPMVGKSVITLDDLSIRQIQELLHKAQYIDSHRKEVAHACGFVDSNYFCRLFRKNTERSPSEYRRQYHSQLTEKPTTPE